MDTNAIFMLTAAIIVAGFLGERLFRRTGAPSFLFLILIGVLLGPVFGILTEATFAPILGIFATLTLVMMLFYGGMDTNLEVLRRTGGRAFFQALLYVVPGVVLIGLAVHVLLGWDWIGSLIFSSMVAGETTAAVMVPLSKSIGLTEETSSFLVMESAINSIFSVIFFFAFVGFYQTGGISYSAVVDTVAANLSVGIVVGLALSMVWLKALRRYRTQQYTYALTLGLLLLTYVASSMVGGNGILAALVFGIVLGNSKGAGKTTGEPDASNLLGRLAALQDEISFLLATLFFVFLGIMVVPSLSAITFGAAMGGMILVLLIGNRYMATTVSTYGSAMKAEKETIVLLMAQGLTPATLAILAYSMGLPLASSYLELVTAVIVFTNVVTTIGAYSKIRSGRKLAAAEEKQAEEFTSQPDQRVP